MSDLLEVAAGFATDHPARRVETFGSGHINDTWLVTTMNGTRYVLQRINQRVFSDALGVARNTAAVCRHLRDVTPAIVPQVVPAQDGSAARVTATGVYRMMTHVEGRAGTPPLDERAAEAAGHAFGRLQRALADYGAGDHVVPIPGFLELPGYLDKFDAALRDGDSRRRDRGRALIDRVMSSRDFAARGMAGPEGMIHGDCKIDNLVFDPSMREVRAVIDLDTVMWGRRAWDFGDLVRSGSVRGAEDSEGLSLDLALYAPIARGFAHGLVDRFDDACKAAFVDAPAYIALTLGTRFLTDFLGGDTYFKVTDESQNLRRAAAQLSLFDDACDKRVATARILDGV